MITIEEVQEKLNIKLFTGVVLMLFTKRFTHKKIELKEQVGCYICTSRVPTNKGYHLVKLKDEKGIRRSYLLHRESFKIFNPNVKLYEKDFILHSCDNPACCNPAHLRKGTQQENMKDAQIRNRNAWGDRSGNTFLTNADVIKIYESNETFKYLSNKYSVKERVIFNIKKKKTWERLTRDLVLGSFGFKKVLSQEDVFNIFHSKLTYKELANIYGIHQSVVHKIWARKHKYSKDLTHD